MPKRTKILIVAANPWETDRLSIEEEYREIETIWMTSEKRNKFKLKYKPAAREFDLRQALSDFKPNIVHFSGHGNKKGLFFMDDNSKPRQMDKQVLAELFGLLSDKIFCVILNACYSKEQADCIAENIDYVIGMNATIGDLAAIKFSTSFYQALFGDDKIPLAYQLGRNALESFDSLEKNTPVLISHRKNLTDDKPSLSSPVNQPLKIRCNHADGIKLIPQDLLAARALLRAGFNADFYYQRPEVDGELFTFYQQSKHVIITGKPLAGKSRAILHFLSQRTNAMIFFPKHNLDNELINYLENYQFDSQLEYFFIFNDMDSFVNNQLFKTLVSTLVMIEQITIIGSCRYSEWGYVESCLEDWVAYFEVLTIPALDESAKKLLNFEIDRSEQLIIDDTIGSFFVPLATIQQSYKKLEILEKEILRSYKCVEFWDNNHKGHKQIIQQYTEKRFKNYYGELEKSIPSVQWDHSFAQLMLLGLIQNGVNKIDIEPAYVDHIIAQDDSEESLAFEIVTYYPNVVSYNKLINGVSNSQLRDQLFVKMKGKGIKPDRVTFNTLLNKCVDFEQAQSVLEKMEQAKIPANEITFTSLLNKAANFKQVQTVFLKMEQAKIATDEITFNSLLNKATDFEQAQAILLKMKQAKVPADKVIFTSLFNKAANFEQAQAILLKMKQAKVPADKVIFTSLLNKATNFEQTQAVLLEMEQAKIAANEITFNSLLNKAADFEQAQSVLDKMEQAKITANEITFTSLLNKAADFEQALSVLEKMEQAKIPANQITFTSLLNKAADFEQALSVLEKMEQAKIPANQITFNSLLNKAADFEQALSILEKMEQAKVTADEITFTSLLNKAADFEQALSVFLKMKRSGIQADKITFNTLLNKTSNFEQALEIFTQSQQAGIQNNQFIFSTLIKKSQGSMGNTDKVINHIEQHQVLLPKQVYFELLKKQLSFTQGWQIYQYMLSANFLPNPKLLNSLAFLSNIDTEAWMVFEQIQKFQVWIYIDGFNHLIEKVSNFNNAWKIYQQMLLLKTTANKTTFILLTKLSSTADEGWDVKQEHDKWINRRNRKI